MAQKANRKWWETGDEGAEIDRLTRESLNTVFEKKASEARARMLAERESRRSKIRMVPIKQKMKRIAYFADHYDFSADTIRGWIKDNLIPAEYIRGSYRIGVEDMAAFVRKENLKRG